jgi:putative membrane protein
VNPKRKRIVVLLSIILPLAVAMLFGVKIDTSVDFSFLPSIYAGINFLTFIILILALTAIKKGNRKRHEILIKVALLLSVIFLLLYILYHITTPSTSYGGEGLLRYVYFFILISHIILSVAVIPLVLIALAWALEKNFEKHKKIARIAMPLWMYVALSGVIVYLMISPYYS